MNHHGYTDVNDNDDSQSCETPKINCCSYYLVIQSSLQPHHDCKNCLHLEKNI